MKKMIYAIWSVYFLAAMLTLANEAQAAEQYPARPIIGLCPVEAGADGDLTWRPPCQKASEFLGQPIVVVNKPGAGGSIAYRELYNAKPDGYTVGNITSSLITNKLQGIIPWDFETYTIIGTFSRSSGIIVGSTKSKHSFKSIEEALSFAKSHPGEVTLAVGSVGSSLWTFATAFLEVTKLKFNVIPQAGSGGYIISQLAGGNIDLGVLLLPSAKAQVDAGNARLLADMGSVRRRPPYDNVPTLKELGYDLVAETFGGVAGPPKMPKGIESKLVKAFEVGGNDPEYRQFLTNQGSNPNYLPPAQAIKYMGSIRALMQSTMDKAGILKIK